MKLLLIPDLHGQKPFIPKEDFDAIVCIGDIASDKGIRPLVKKWIKQVHKEKEKVITFDEFIEKEIGSKKADKLEEDSLKVGNKILKSLDKFGKPIFFVPGNWDKSYGETRIKDPDKSIYNRLKMYLDYYLGEEINKILIKGVKNVINLWVLILLGMD
jgi:Icc-related predicted phosphoesterase